MTTRKQKTSAQPRTTSIRTRSSGPPLNTPAGTQGEPTDAPSSPPPQKIRVPKRVRKQFQVELIEQRRRTLRSAMVTSSQGDVSTPTETPEQIETNPAQVEGESSNAVVCGVAAEKGETALSEKLEGAEKGEKPKEGEANVEIKEKEGDEKGETPIEGDNPSEIAKGGDLEEFDSANEDFGGEEKSAEEVTQEASIDLNRDPKSVPEKATGEEEVHSPSGDEAGTVEGDTSAQPLHHSAADPEGGPDTGPTTMEVDEDEPLITWKIQNINKGKFISGKGLSITPDQDSSPRRRLVKSSEKEARKTTPTPKSTPRSVGTRSSSKGPPVILEHFPHEEPLKEGPSSASKQPASPKKDQGSDTGSSKKSEKKEQSTSAGPIK